MCLSIAWFCMRPESSFCPKWKCTTLTEIKRTTGWKTLRFITEVIISGIITISLVLLFEINMGYGQLLRMVINGALDALKLSYGQILVQALMVGLVATVVHVLLLECENENNAIRGAVARQGGA